MSGAVARAARLRPLVPSCRKVALPKPAGNEGPASLCLVDSVHPVAESWLTPSLAVWSGGERDDRVGLILATTCPSTLRKTPID
ncbi:hypothetical protein DFP72DRAFT_1042821 [Ephemerocybe angulata]|uniref:Uncharacterized protein n=1 Tax=Ephemerocybe angulata TaxID=980116 RepID=A0A8H6I9C1_9AGAR|nr:hypothetical protein DFP72DRAFT_1042821 [Tulosesus angulatus]